ncbi:protein-export chaperone SecB [Solilutibacter silvestris]|uniref:Protein-export protein SecB n=1 Tax=Solilutibacter silvestris TaxID=1645665 RepID=A0A2K1Q0T9_9GAMM|nr:protein-export chaperone SecB [Lysobacter silvestris]PNS08668.1 secB: protein-export chaperone SecB [Lysobacter silvestris]
MSDETTNGAIAPAAAEEQGATFSVEKIYTRDVSFEAPNAPVVFSEQGQPDLQMNLNQRVGQVAENAYEVVLGVTLTCTLNGKTAYLAEVQQAGVFGLSGFDAASLDAMLGSHCPSILYPYARQAISELINGGGFPPFYLQPINFDALYAEGLRQRATQGEGTALESGTETAGNA